MGRHNGSHAALKQLMELQGTRVSGGTHTQRYRTLPHTKAHTGNFIAQLTDPWYKTDEDEQARETTSKLQKLTVSNHQRNCSVNNQPLQPLLTTKPQPQVELLANKARPLKPNTNCNSRTVTSRAREVFKSASYRSPSNCSTVTPVEVR
ncbi:hypothetical protein J6590_052824 [Homalodisca vitripennis]|nr:hypothetical protein J6590_052824 [Homalodisca vitripennis]